jgi:hypothetical protein
MSLRFGKHFRQSDCSIAACSTTGSERLILYRGVTRSDRNARASVEATPRNALYLGVILLETIKLIARLRRRPTDRWTARDATLSRGLSACSET